MAIGQIVLLVTLTIFAEAKVYDRCELARELKHVHELPRDQIATWVCIAKYESDFNTSAVNPGSGDHGLFQISDVYWCSPPGQGYACNLPCSSLEDDDISDDVGCIRRIFREHQYLSGDGFNAWVVYPSYCKGDVQRYVEGCFDNEIDNNIVEENNTEVYEFPPFPTITSRPTEEYEFPPLPTTPKWAKLVSPSIAHAFPTATTTKKYSIATTIQPFTKKYSIITTLKPFTHAFPTATTTKKYSIATTVQPLTKKYSIITTPKPFTHAFPTATTTKKYSIATSVQPLTKKYSIITSKPFIKKYSVPSTLEPLTIKESSTFKPFTSKYSVFSTFKPFTKEISISTTTQRPFQTHSSGHKREQKFYGANNVEYSFVWKPNGAPVLLSFPHLLYADEEYVTVDGLKPNKEIHDTFVILEPMSGTPLKMAKRVQFNMFVRPIQDITSIENVTNALIPIFWIEESMTLTDKYVDLLKMNLFRNLKILEIIKWSLIGIGGAVAAVSALLIIYSN